jgi:hypothetical protein
VTTTDQRKAELLRRAGKDPVVLDTRSSGEVLSDEIPYARWAKELNVIKRAGYRNWLALLEDRHRAKKAERR